MSSRRLASTLQLIAAAQSCSRSARGSRVSCVDEAILGMQLHATVSGSRADPPRRKLVARPPLLYNSARYCGHSI
jgi:hypothetical protein